VRGAVLSVTHSRGGVCGRQPGVSRGCAAEFRRQKYAEKKRTAATAEAVASKYDDVSGVGAVRVRRLAGRRRRRVRRPPAPLRRRLRESIKYRQLHTPARARVPRRRCFRTRARISTTAAARLSVTEFSAVHIPRGGDGGT